MAKSTGPCPKFKSAEQGTSATEMQPFEQMPIWARLAFMEMVPKTYSWDEEFKRPRRSDEAVVYGFYRDSDVVWISFELSWEDPTIAHLYLWPVEKDKEESCDGYIYSPSL